MRTTIFFICAIILVPIALACSTSSELPNTPDMARNSDTSMSRQLWGFWDVDVIPDGHGSASLIFTPRHTTQVHLNVVGIMESGGDAAVGIEPPVTLVDGILDVNVKLTHPFEGLDKFTGFDVRGILIGHGSMGGFSESLFYAGPTDMQLLNADGHSRLWNPTEYTGSGYVDGKLSAPDAIKNYTATLNPYKYFADDLTANQSIPDMLKVKRGAFTAGKTNVRHYQIKLGDKGLSFQYAVDANWWTPTEPVVVPDSFDPAKANCPEPYHMEVWMGPGIYSDGGSAKIIVDVYDWQKDVTGVSVEAPLLYDGITELSDPQDNGDFVTYTGNISNVNLPAGNRADILIYARGTDPVTLKEYTCYRLFSYPIVHVPDGGVIITVQDDKFYKTKGVEYTYISSGYDYGTGNPPPVDYADHDGPWDFTGIPADSSSTREALDPNDPEVASFKSQFSGNVTHFFKTEVALTGTPQSVYQAEAHNEGANLLRLWGMHTSEPVVQDIQDFPLDPPIDFQYPETTSTDYTVSQNYTLIPFLLTMKVTYHLWGMGEGVAFVPIQPGVNGWGWDVQAALETRSFAAFETGGLLGQGDMGKALLYTWTADDGLAYGSISAGNSPGSDPNFDEGTFDVTGGAAVNTLQMIN